MRPGQLGALLALGLFAGATSVHADPAPGPADLQSVTQRDTRNSAYSLPRGTWGFGAGAFGLGGGDAIAKLGVAYGLGAGVEMQINVAHASVGILNFATFWQFIDTPHFALAARAGIWYGHGEWFWILTEPGEDLVSDIDVLNVPLILAASMPISKQFQFDFDVRYTYANIYGAFTQVGAIFRDPPFGLRQFELRPGVRIFLTDTTELDITANLPLYSSRSYARPEGMMADGQDFKKVPFSDTWGAEFGPRSRLMENLFGSVRLHYSAIARGFYGTSLYPSFDVELRL